MILGKGRSVFLAVASFLSARAEFCVAQFMLTVLIVVIVGLLAFTAYGSLAASLAISICAGILWTYITRL